MNKAFTKSKIAQKNIFWKISFLMVIISFNYAKAQVYCSPSFGGTACSFVPYIDFSISSASFSGVTFCSGVPCPTDYGDYYATYTANLTEGTPYALTINYNASSSLVEYSIFCGAWIDWNNDGTFNDATERIMTTNVGPAGATTQTGANFTPTNVGTFRMRIIVQTGSNPTDPCTVGGLDNGEAKDFKVVVAPNAVGINSINEPLNLSVYPNPSELNGIYIDGLKNLNKNIEVKLLNILGKTIEQKWINSNSSGTEFIELNNLSKGIYYLELSDGISVQNFKVIFTN